MSILSQQRLQTVQDFKSTFLGTHPPPTHTYTHSQQMDKVLAVMIKLLPINIGRRSLACSKRERGREKEQPPRATNLTTNLHWMTWCADGASYIQQCNGKQSISRDFTQFFQNFFFPFFFISLSTSLLFISFIRPRAL